MRKIIFLALWLCFTINAQEPALLEGGEASPLNSAFSLTIEESAQQNNSLESEKAPKNIYLTLLDFPTRTLYTREIIAVTYRLLVLAPYTSILTEFASSDESVKILNKDSRWKRESDGSFSNTFYFKILNENFLIPSMRVMVQMGDYQESDEVQGHTGHAIMLDRNSLFSHVIAKDLTLTDYKIATYDNENNLAVFRIQGNEANLEDFHLDGYERQGIESSNLTPMHSSIIYYVVLPKNDEVIEFDYFSTQEYQYRRISLQNLATDEKISTQSDIKPKNTLYRFELFLLGTLFVILLVLYFYRRHIFYLLVALILLGYLLYSFSFKNTGILKVGVEVMILPTYNSTVILNPQTPTKVEILGTRHGYYKILSEDEKIGWVKKEYIEKD